MPRSHASSGRLLDQEYDLELRTFYDLKPIARLADKIGNVEDRERVCTMHFKVISRPQHLQGLARLHRGKRTSQSG